MSLIESQPVPPSTFGPASRQAPRLSATLILLRDSDQGPQVLMVQRADRGDQNSNTWVFPGGLLDPSDTLVLPWCAGLDAAQANARMGMASGALEHMAAALRETLEEAGLLLALDAQGQPLGADAAAAWTEWRTHSRQLPAGQAGAALAALLEQHQWRLAVDGLVPLSHWITPVGMPKRFDTRFLLARAPMGQDVQVDGVEIVAHRWARPQDLLQPQSDIRVIGPTRVTLQELAPHPSVDALLAWAEARGPQGPIQPRLGRDPQGRIGPVHPSHVAYPEIGLIDPEGRGHACHVIEPGKVVALGPDCLRITAPNGSVMTGPGTNTYLLRCGPHAAAPQGGWVMIDPGPQDEAHVQTLKNVLAQQAEPLLAILVTHTHIDHSPAARALGEHTGAPVLGRLPQHPQWQDRDFVADQELQDGQWLDFGSQLQIQVLHTPGHASNHLCFVAQGPSRPTLLFTGDHVMQGSTVVINPPDGDMAAYLASLERLSAFQASTGLTWIAPGHGFLIADPARALKTLVRHRQRREAKVLSALNELAAASTAPGHAVSLDDLLVQVYDDVPVAKHGVARRSLLAHVLHLQAQGLVQCSGPQDAPGELVTLPPSSGDTP